MSFRLNVQSSFLYWCRHCSFSFTKLIPCLFFPFPPGQTRPAEWPGEAHFTGFPAHTLLPHHSPVPLPPPSSQHLHLSDGFTSGLLSPRRPGTDPTHRGLHPICALLRRFRNYATLRSDLETMVRLLKLYPQLSSPSQNPGRIFRLSEDFCIWKHFK